MMMIHVITFIAVVVAIAPTYGAPQNDSALRQDLASDLENWMSLLPADLRQVPLNLLAIPGTHDSFTVDISSESEVSPDGEEILKKLEFLSVVKRVMANWSKTQAFDVTQQLKAGIRFFDLRFCFDSDNGNLYFCHSLYSTEVRSVLIELSSYLNTHPNEVVILDCQHFYNFTTDIHSELTQMFEELFGSKFIPYQSSMASLTLENLSTLKQQVMVVYRDSATQSQQNMFWPSESYPTPWYDTMNATYLISSLDEGLKIRSNAIGHISQLLLTPSIDDILGNLLSTLKQMCAVEFKDIRTDWISSQTPGVNGVNVIIADFIDLDDDTFSKTVVNLNSKLNAERLGRGGILQRIEGFFQGIKNFVF